MTTVIEGVALSTVCADDLGAHVFRHQVARELRPYWPARARALESCGEAGARLRCLCCGGFHVAPFRCAARSCPTCAHITSAVAVDKLSARAEGVMAKAGLESLWEGEGWPRHKRWIMFTGTQQTAGAYGASSRYELANLLPAIRRARKGWGVFWRATWGARVYERSAITGILGTRLRRDTIFAMGVEVAPGGMVHGHAAIYGEYHRETDRSRVRAAWREAIGRQGHITVAPMKASTPGDFKESLREVLKYCSKGEHGARRVVHAAAIERAMYRVRRVEIGGALRARAWQPTSTDVAMHAQACTDCGTTGQWAWGGIRSAEWVVGNGGFGVDHSTKLTAAMKDTRARFHARGAEDLSPDEWSELDG